MPVKSARAVQTKVVRFRTFKRPAPAASFGCCRFQSNFVGFASVPGGLIKAILVLSTLYSKNSDRAARDKRQELGVWIIPLFTTALGLNTGVL
jgi:hypothetical protein